ncbi:MAG: DMT family transporter [Paenibacillaceae bacterium]
MRRFSRMQTVLLIAFLIAVWGLSWPILKIALTFSPPILFTGMRTLLGGLVLLIIAIPRYKRLNFKQTWPIYLICALLNVILYHGLHTIGLNYMPSGLLAAIVYLQPVLVGIFAWLWLGEAMYDLKIVGLILGFLGVGIISGAGLLGQISIIGILLALGSSLSWALGTIYVKKIGTVVDSIWLVTLQFIVGGIVMIAVGTGSESWSDIVWNPTFILCLLFTAIFVFALGWLVYFELIFAGEASKVSSYTFLIPTVAILMGTLFMDEPFTISLMIGLVLILISIYYVNRTPRKVGVLTSEEKFIQ